MTISSRDASVTLAPPGGFRLKHGGLLPAVRVAFTIYGRTHDAPVILVCHAITGSSKVGEWCGDILGPGKLLDTDRYCVIGSNVIGSCYGSTGPQSTDKNGLPFGRNFPIVGIEDMVRAQREAIELLGIRRLHAVIGGSLGGMQALQWGSAHPLLVEKVIAIGATGRLSPMAIGLNSIAREAIKLDPTTGLKIARMIGMLSYKSATLLWQRHGRRSNRDRENPAASLHARFDVEGYLQHQGEKLAARMDADSFLYLTKAMDLFELDAANWRTPALLVGIESDWLYPPDEVRATAADLSPHGTYVELKSEHGHDGFLADAGQLSELVAPFLNASVPASGADDSSAIHASLGILTP
ncbi:MAG TPA: homoserine O-acetyltransferase [Candidatus Eremiobacteraceae bacterium]|nr:homoserine O-acetyltransferase [Candidatus Eremiobacteraceae bacterium]